jgi:DNA-binding PadR family transcriptional regulator
MLICIINGYNIVTVDDICPSCNHEKEQADKPLCFYCFYRAQHNTMKMLTLDSISKINRHVFTEDLKDELDNLPFMKKPVKESSLRKLLHRYVKLGLITVRKKRTKHAGRPRLSYMISKYGKKMLSKYIHRWKTGKLLTIYVKGKPRRLKTAEDERALCIAQRINKEIENHEDIFKFILPMRSDI